jgi:hypothetical protein
VPRGPLAPPADPALPQLGALLEPGPATDLLQRALGRPGRVDEVRVTRVAYVPGVKAAVHYEAFVDRAPADAVAQAAAGADLAERLTRSRFRRLAARAAPRSPAAWPVVHDAELDVLVSWLPFDAKLPALASPPDELAALLRAVRVDVDPRVGAPVLLADAYKPGSRCVMILAGHYLKEYGNERQYAAALRGMVAAGVAPVRTAPFEASFPVERLTVQEAVAGSAAPATEEVAVAAGDLAWRLRATPGADLLQPVPPEALLATARESAAITRAVAPDLAPRLERLAARLRDRLPEGLPLVPSHGDYDVDQLIAADGRLVAIDFDDMCLAPAALDLATYLADEVLRDGPLHADALVEGYGERPPALEWYVSTVLLDRSPRWFHRLTPDWRERTEALLGAAEEWA